MCYTRNKKKAPWQDIEIWFGQRGIVKSNGEVVNEDIQFNPPQYLKKITYALGKDIKDRILCYRTSKYPCYVIILGNFLKRRFKPRVLDRYPPTDEDRAYYPFPGNDLSLFCFP